MDIAILQEFKLSAATPAEEIDNIYLMMDMCEQEVVPVTHTFHGGMYAKTIYLKAGTALTGVVHETEHINIISQGDVTVINEEGESRITGFNILKCKAGSKRAGVVHEDTIWTTIFKTDETDPEKIESDLVSQGKLLLGGN
jgi:hypothetical protein